jgi:hypothetical protein
MVVEELTHAQVISVELDTLFDELGGRSRACRQRGAGCSARGIRDLGGGRLRTNGGRGIAPTVVRHGRTTTGRTRYLKWRWLYHAARAGAESYTILLEPPDMSAPITLIYLRRRLSSTLRTNSTSPP